ncbi:MAG TPA: molybdopterin-dependent oxidoreductase [Saprospiraceae bacterium]|nr:molybdopterin-dependent oxidoreductase [Saprospiraceae bacterium]
MTTINKKLDRRSFVKVSAAAGGGIVLGFTWLSSCSRPERAEIIPELEIPDSWVEMNSYLKIGENGVVTIISQNPEVGQNVKTSMPMIVADELDVDWNQVIVEQAPLNTKSFTRQVAGGSQSIRAEWDNLRRAGASAKAVLIAAAAREWDIDPDECTTSKGMISSSNGHSMSYGEAAAKATDIEINVEEVKLKKTEEFTIIRTDRTNVDMQKIVTGKPLFGIDTRREGMLYASVMRPPAFGQKLVSFDDTDARNVGGVVDVFRFKEKIAVIATSNWAAMKGKKELKAVWTQDSPAESTDYHNEILLKLLDEPASEPRRSDGDVVKAFAEADQVIERVFEAPFLPHNCLEPMNFFAHVTDEKVDCTGPIQTPAGTQMQIARALGREREDIHIMLTRMGGGFGRRLYGDFALEACEISQLSGKPIQLLFTREDDMASGYYRPATKYKIRAALKNGEITGYHLTEACVNGNMYGLIPNFFPAWCIDNYLVETHRLDSNISIGAWRAPYTNFLAYAEQSFFDEVAEALGQDAVELRMSLFEKAKQHQQDERMQWSPERMQGVLKLAAEKSGWGKKEPGLYQGVSVYYSHNTAVAQVADVKFKNGEPLVTKVTVAVDCGIVVNPIAAKNQVEGGVIDGIGHAMYGDLIFENGVPKSKNFHEFRLIKMHETPDVEVHFVENNLSPTGLGEPALPPAGAAVANALYKATGKRLYSQPFIKTMAVLG